MIVGSETKPGSASDCNVSCGICILFYIYTLKVQQVSKRKRRNPISFDKFQNVIISYLYVIVT